MAVKKLVLGILGFVGISVICTGCFLKKENSTDIENTLSEKKTTTQVATKQENIKKHDLYSEAIYDLPLFSIVEISTLPNELRNTINKLLESAQGFYFLKKYDDKIFVILQNSVSSANTYTRHNLEFAEIDTDGNITYNTAGFTGAENEISNAIEQKDDLWLFDESIEPFRPKKHTVYNEKGKIKFTETWNYDDTDPIKYQMKDSRKKVISILKESQDNDSNLRREHIFYDGDGNIVMSLTVNYDGANISRLTFYNSDDSIDSFSIITEYTDGLKTKESIYNADYVLEKTILSEYENGIRKKIKVLDAEENEITKIY